MQAEGELQLVLAIAMDAFIGTEVTPLSSRYPPSHLFVQVLDCVPARSVIENLQ